MSSSVPKSKREKRGPRLSIHDFSHEEYLIIESAKTFFGSPVVVFGSRARGDWAEDSDIDIGVSGYSHKNHKSVVTHLSKLTEIKVDLFKIEHARTHRAALEV